MTKEGYTLIDFTQFYRGLVVCIGDKEMLRKCLIEYHDEAIADWVLENIKGSEMGKTIYHEATSLFLLWMPHIPKTTLDVGFLSHEIFHAVYAVMSGIGSKLSDDSEEVFAYLITFLTQKIIEEFSISFSCDQEPESEQTKQQSSPLLKSSDSSEV